MWRAISQLPEIGEKTASFENAEAKAAKPGKLRSRAADARAADSKDHECGPYA